MLKYLKLIRVFGLSINSSWGDSTIVAFWNNWTNFVQGCISMLHLNFLHVLCWQAWKWWWADSEWHDSIGGSRISSNMNICMFLVTHPNMLCWRALKSLSDEIESWFDLVSANSKSQKSVRSDSYSYSRRKCSVHPIRSANSTRSNKLGPVKLKKRIGQRVYIMWHIWV